MKLSTARRLVCMSYFTVDGLRPLLATATRIVCSGDTKRFLFPDGSVIESVKGNWKVIGMEKNSKLEAAVRRFGNGQKLPDPIMSATGSIPVVRTLERPKFGPERYEFDAKLPTDERCHLLASIAALQELCNEKDEQIDKASRPMVVRLDWWAVALVCTVMVAHGLGWL